MKINNSTSINSLVLIIFIIMLSIISCKKDSDGDDDVITPSTTVTDIDGNTYSIVNISGMQIWMGENLKTTRYNDNTPIPLATNDSDWDSWEPGYCWYNNDEETYKDTYGALYNWHTVNTGNLCPTGWHVPTDKEWGMLITLRGGYDLAGDELKEAGTSHWISPDPVFNYNGATNTSGFTALPAGFRGPSGRFDDIGTDSYWWCSTEYDIQRGWTRKMDNYSSKVSKFYGYGYKTNGYSVRCIKD